MTLGLLVVGSVGDNPPKNFKTWTLDLPSLKDLRGPRGFIYPTLPRRCWKITTLETHPSSESSGVLCDPTQEPENCFFQAISIYGDSGITFGIQIAVYFMNLENPETQEFLEVIQDQTTVAWPSHSWFPHMDGGHPANWKSKCLRASIWQCVMFPQLLGREACTSCCYFLQCCYDDCDVWWAEGPFSH